MRMGCPVRRYGVAKALLHGVAALLTVAGAPVALAAPVLPTVMTTGQAGDALTLQQAVAAAVSRHPALRGARSLVEQAAAGIDAARANYYPSISAGITSEMGDDPNGDFDNNMDKRAQVNASQLLYDFGQTSSQVDRAAGNRDVAQAQFQQTYADVVRNTAAAWLQVRKYLALTKVSEEQLAAVQELAGLAERREKIGASTHSDTTQADARVEAARAQLLQARSETLRWRSVLMHWMAASVPPRVVPDGDIPLLDTSCENGSGAVAPVDQSEPASVAVAQARLVTARAAKEVANTQLRPTLSLKANASRRLGSATQRVNEPESDRVISLDVSVPLYQGGQLRSQRTAAIYAEQAATASLQQARLAADREMQSTVTQWLQYRDLRHIQQQRAHSMSVTRELYRRQYLKLGTRSLLDLLNSEQEYYGVLSDLKASRFQFYSLGVDCLYYRGQLRSTFSNTQRQSGAS